MPPKLYLAVRSDLAVGLAAAQLVHAAIDWALDRREEALAFRRESNTVVLVEVPSKEALEGLHQDLGEGGGTLFVDPDVGKGEATAMTLHLAPASTAAGRKLPLFAKKRG